jgi:hypothetical protein
VMYYLFSHSIFQDKNEVLLQGIYSHTTWHLGHIPTKEMLLCAISGLPQQFTARPFQPGSWLTSLLSISNPPSLFPPPHSKQVAYQ